MTNEARRPLALKSTALATLLLWLAMQTAMLAEDTVLPAFHPTEGLSLASGGSIRAPAEGLWSIGTGWQDDAPTHWSHAQPDKVESFGTWAVLSGTVKTPDGDWLVRDQYKQIRKGLIQAKRRWEFAGTQPTGPTVLAIEFQVERGDESQPLRTFLPGINYFGNPSGTRIDASRVPTWSGKVGEEALYEEHRYPMPLASVECDEQFVAAIHSRPSTLPYAARQDLWWSMGVIENATGTRLALRSGPVASNGQRGIVKARQQEFLPYTNASLDDVPPGAVIEKTFYLQLADNHSSGHGFSKPLWTSIELFDPTTDGSMPRIVDVIDAKFRDTFNRWYEDDQCRGFRTRPPQAQPWFMMGWADRAEVPGYALLALDLTDSTDEPQLWRRRGMQSLEFLIKTPSLNSHKDADFSIIYDYEQHKWLKRQNLLSQAQALNSLADSYRLAREGGAELKTLASDLEEFLKLRLSLIADRILTDDWRPVSTNEAFAIAPLVKGSELFGEDRLMSAARKLADHTIERHGNMKEPYWGGTLDAKCEDKEGAWAAFQGFAEMYRVTQRDEYLEAAVHAADICLSYMYVWDVTLPPGRLADHGLKTRGWTSVSVQNQHLDVFGVIFVPQLWQLGQWTGDTRYQDLAKLILVSAGQMTDLPTGMHGEQLFQTNYQQHNAGDTVEGMRGGYSEAWNIYWISANFLTAVARLEELGVDWKDF